MVQIPQRQIKVTLGDDHDAWIALAERMGVRPAILAKQVMRDFLHTHGFASAEVRQMLPQTQGNVGIYFQLTAAETEKLDRMAWLLYKTRQSLVKSLVISALR